MNNYEVGFKSRLLGSKLELNVAAFYMDYEDMQVRTSIILNELPTQILSNAASATSKGLEIELRALPTENLMISAGLGLVDATYGDFPGNQDQKAGTYINAKGNKLALSADVTFNAAAQHTMPMQDGTLLTRLDVSYIDERYSVQGIINTEDFLLDSMTQVNARASYQPNNSALTAAVWVRNLTDDDSLTYKAYNNVFGAAGISGMYAPPRSWGVSFGYEF
jgi:iron complex outermembrane receptor protein